MEWQKKIHESFVRVLISYDGRREEQMKKKIIEFIINLFCVQKYESEA